ncbi:hypothetical protein ACN083_04530 [Rothia sp. CCM 9418]|uniref:hypothetical protein n=1 Tax=Rothia sp. CCM 9418 TaxID=3402661 RepID=UPI003AEA4BCB
MYCTDTTADHVESNGFDENIVRQMEELACDVEDRNATFFLQQEALIDSARLDLKAKFDAKIRDYQAKEATANKVARKASSASEELKLKQEARQWRRKIDDAEDEYRNERNRLRYESEELLDRAQDALQAKQSRQVLFTVNWEVK